MLSLWRSRGTFVCEDVARLGRTGARDKESGPSLGKVGLPTGGPPIPPSMGFLPILALLGRPGALGVMVTGTWWGASALGAELLTQAAGTGQALGSRGIDRPMPPSGTFPPVETSG